MTYNNEKYNNISISHYVCPLRHHGTPIQKPPTDGLYTTLFVAKPRPWESKKFIRVFGEGYGFDDVAMHEH